MGLFDWMFRPKPRRAPARIWMTNAAMLRALVAEVRLCMATGCRILIVAHFPAKRTEIAGLLDAADIAYELLTERFDRINAGRWGEPVGLLLAEQIDVDDWQDNREELADNVSIVAVERHPIRERDEAIDVLGRGWSPRTPVVSFLSLDDPLMKMFAGDWVRQTLRSLGMKESESIESEMVRRRIEGALRKVESRTFGDEPADSLEDWLRRNCPDYSDSSN